MPIVLQLTKRLDRPPLVSPVPGIQLRHYAGTADIEPWLELRRRAFARQQVGIGNWSRGDFEREFLAKSWWGPTAMWLATADSPAGPSLVGTVTLARRTSSTGDKPVVHWLAVLPSFRRHGLGGYLLSTLEAAVWQAGARQIWLETHVAWLEANRLYERHGYLPEAPPASSD